ncbi:MAG: GNAT family N-acetyltransferase [Xanthomonadaceae bacterium]|nr:GNAT family N-acetyltransferase [Xanthomonadaceae bacterium]
MNQRLNDKPCGGNDGQKRGLQKPERLDWRLRRFDELPSRQLYAILAARLEVFVVEQNCPYQDLDGLDSIARHLSAWTSRGELAAYARILPPETRFEQPSIGRVLTVFPRRRSGLGIELMHRAIAAAAEAFPGHDVRISAQRYLQEFYRRLGFEIDSQPYLEDGIPHVEMQLPVERARRETNQATDGST